VKLLVNGEPREVREDITVSDLLQELKLATERVAVEVNLAVVRKAHHAEHRLRDGDKVEVVTFVGGG